MNRLTLPLPPSANRYWRAIARGKTATNILSESGRKYKELADVCGAAQKTRVLEGPVRVHATVFFPNRRGDLDNRIKPTLDALQGVCFANDSQIWEVTFSRATDKDRPRVEITVEEIEEAA